MGKPLTDAILDTTNVLHSSYSRFKTREARALIRKMRPSEKVLLREKIREGILAGMQPTTIGMLILG